jgi:hypothetical protein
MKYKFLKFLKYKIFKQKEWEVNNKFVNFVYSILCPFEYYCRYNNSVYYDSFRNIYNIEGIELSKDMIDDFINVSNTNRIFRFISNNDGAITIRTYDPNIVNSTTLELLTKPNLSLFYENLIEPKQISDPDGLILHYKHYHQK